MEEMRIIVKGNQARFIYSDHLRNMASMGKAVTRRASHVEPHGNGWKVDLSPVDGPMLGPFETRTEALAVETHWLKANNIPIPN